MKRCPYPLEDLLPHRPPMILLDDVVDWDENSLTSILQIRAAIPFFKENEGVAAHVAIEWMAQTCAAYAGMQDLLRGEKIRLGLLLGTRNFQALVPWFRIGENLMINVVLSYRDDTVGVFDCSIFRNKSDLVCATAQLTVYQPVDTKAFLDTQGMAERTA